MCGGIIVTKRFLSAVLCLALLLTLPVQAMAAGADANTPQTHPNTYTNTGNQRVDIIGVAKTQVGYYEYPENNTKYGAALGINHLGWCGAFVSWCAIQAGVPDSVLKKTGVANPASYGLATKYYPEYIPQSGDLFFTPSNSHVGLVYYLDGEYFYSLEGNTWSQGPQGVYIRRHKLSDMKYGSPNYQGGGNHSYASDSEVAHPHKVFYHCSDCGDKYYTGATTTRTDCVTCKQNTCTHSYGKWGNLNTAQHSRTCTKCSKVDSSNHSWNAGTVTTKADCSHDGVKTHTCTVCGATKTSAIPKDQSHVYGNWSSQDTYGHARFCNLCNTREYKAHTWDSGTVTQAPTCVDTGIKTFTCTGCGEHKEQVLSATRKHEYTPWVTKDNDRHIRSCVVCGMNDGPYLHKFSGKLASDQTQHWKECADCKLRINEEKHVFGEACDSPCTICNYKSDTGHHFAEEWSKDENSHWYACQSCDIQGSAAYHQFDNACDGLCDTCGFERVVQHTFTDEYLHDGQSHWQVCTVCGVQEGLSGHEPCEPAYEGAATYCLVCELVLTEEKNHEHILSESHGDGINHWGVCVCGEIMESEPHIWSMKTGACSVCNAPRPETTAKTDDAMPWILGGVGLAGLVTVLVVLIIRISIKTRKKEEELV